MVTSPRCVPVSSTVSLSSLPAAAVLHCFFRCPGSPPLNYSPGQGPLSDQSFCLGAGSLHAACFLHAQLSAQPAQHPTPPPPWLPRCRPNHVGRLSSSISSRFPKPTVLTHLPQPCPAWAAGCTPFLAAQAVPRVHPPAQGCSRAPEPALLLPELCSDD